MRTPRRILSLPTHFLYFLFFLSTFLAGRDNGPCHKSVIGKVRYPLAIEINTMRQWRLRFTHNTSERRSACGNAFFVSSDKRANDDKTIEEDLTVHVSISILKKSTEISANGRKRRCFHLHTMGRPSAILSVLFFDLFYFRLKERAEIVRYLVRSVFPISSRVHPW